MNGTERAIDAAMLSLLPNMPSSSAQYAVKGFTPMRAMSTPPTMNDSRSA